MEGDFIITSEEIRCHNRTIVEKYMTMVGQERENRWKIFTDDAATGLQYTATGESLVISGIDNIRQGDKFNCKNSPNCGFTNIEIFCSDAPHSFPLNAMAKGTAYVSGRPVHHKDHYAHKFLFRDGKICLYREFMNPCNELIELGVTTPEAPVTTEDMTEA